LTVVAGDWDLADQVGSEDDTQSLIPRMEQCDLLACTGPTFLLTWYDSNMVNMVVEVQ
jgi:hypothetical protein